MKKLMNLIYHPTTHKVCNVLAIAFVIGFIFTQNVYAADPTLKDSTDPIGDLTKLIAGWFQKIGGVIILFGGVQTAFGIRTEDPEIRNKGLLTVAAGAAVTTIATMYTK